MCLGCTGKSGLSKKKELALLFYHFSNCLCHKAAFASFHLIRPCSLVHWIVLSHFLIKTEEKHIVKLEFKQADIRDIYLVENMD